MNPTVCTPFDADELKSVGSGGWSFACQPTCLGCSDDGLCVTSMETALMDEVTAIGSRFCWTDNQGNTMCVTRIGGPQVIGTDAITGLPTLTPVHTYYDCMASLNGNECDCSPCNGPNVLQPGQSFNVQVTCSDGTSLDQCAGTSSGLSLLTAQLDASRTCPHLENHPTTTENINNGSNENSQGSDVSNGPTTTNNNNGGNNDGGNDDPQGSDVTDGPTTTDNNNGGNNDSTQVFIANNGSPASGGTTALMHLTAAVATTTTVLVF